MWAKVSRMILSTLHGRFYMISSVWDETLQERKCSFKVEDWGPDFHSSSNVILAHAQP